MEGRVDIEKGDWEKGIVVERDKTWHVKWSAGEKIKSLQEGK